MDGEAGGFTTTLTAPVRLSGRDDLLTVLRQEREARRMTHLDMDAQLGLASGHYGKIERMGAGWGKQAFRMTAAIVWILDLFGLELIIAPRGMVAAQTIEREARLIPETPTYPAVRKASSRGQVARWAARRRRELGLPAGKKKPRTA